MDMTSHFDIMQFFVSMLIVGIGVALLATGLFTSYFGAGKSQKIGFALLFLGVISLTLTYFMAFGEVNAIPTLFDAKGVDGELKFMDALISGVAALGGMIIGMFAILLVLMKVDTVDDLEDLDLEDLEDLDLDEELKKLEEELNQADVGNEDENDDENSEDKK